MSHSDTEQPTFKRQIGLVSLTLIATGGILGSGWLFSPLITAQLAGPAAIISWLIGAAAMIFLALCFAEISSVLPVAGGIARIPRYTHGDITAAVIGWSAWVGYSTQAAIEVEVLLRYASQTWPALIYTGTYNLEGQLENATLSVLGFAIAAGLLILFVIINAIGAATFARANSTITWLKLAIPCIIAITFIASRFDVDNFHTSAGFAPYGWHGILAAVSTGGVIFSLIGFRHAIDMAGESRNPTRDIPLALIFGLLIPLFIYLLLQVAFIGVLNPSDLKNGWMHIELKHKWGPLASLSITLGVSWLTACIYGGALIGPAGGALVATGSCARLTYALAQNRFLPTIFQKLSQRGIPVNALILNFVLGFILITLLAFEKIVAVNTAAIVLSFTIGPAAVIALRKQIPNTKRRFSIPIPKIIAALAFTISTLIIYWSGWGSVLILLLITALSITTLLIKRLLIEKESWSSFDLRESLWLIPYLGSITLLSWAGNFGGKGYIHFGLDILLLTVLALINLKITCWCSMSNKKATIYRKANKPVYKTRKKGLDK